MGMVGGRDELGRVGRPGGILVQRGEWLDIDSYFYPFHMIPLLKCGISCKEAACDE